MLPRIKTQSQRIITLTNYTLCAIVLARAMLQYGRYAEATTGLAMLAVFLLLLASEPNIARRWSAYRGVYFGLQTALVLTVGSFAPEFDFLWSLYVSLGIYAILNFSRRSASIAIGVLIVIAARFLIVAMGVAVGLATLLNLIALSYFIVWFTRLTQQAEIARAESDALLRDLQTAHARLQTYAAQVEELSVMQERNRLARDLHDSVNHTIFSLTLTAEAARLLLDKDPARVPEQLDRLQDMSGSALGQLRSLITRLRPVE